MAEENLKILDEINISQVVKHISNNGGNGNITLNN